MILNKIITLFCISFLFNTFAMQQQINQTALALIAGTASYKKKSETQTEWYGKLNNGKSITLNVFRKARRTRHTKSDDMFNETVKGRIDKKRLLKEQAEQWYRCLADSCPESFVFELQ